MLALSAAPVGTFISPLRGSRRRNRRVAVLRVVPLEGNADDPNTKGTIFERFVREVLESAGYDHIEMRARRIGVEYDLMGVTSFGTQKVVGEAKAWDRRVPVDLITSFVGKMVPIWSKDPGALGLFLTVSELTPEAREFTRATQESKANLTVIDGEALENILTRKKGFPPPETIGSRCMEELSRHMLDMLYVATEVGDFAVGLLEEPGKTLPDSYVVFNHASQRVTDEKTLRLLGERIPELESLTPFGLAEGRPHHAERGPVGFIHSSSDWFDYRFPASPNRFVGRFAPLTRLETLQDEIVRGQKSNRIVQILSRSGVGKSSFALKAQSVLEAKGVTCIPCDVRNLRNEIDLVALFQELCQRIGVPIPHNAAELDSTLESLAKNRAQPTCIFLDQFESLFARPRLFNTVLDLISESIYFGSGLVFVVTRKNDQPTTWDAISLVDLGRLREVSETILLNDFTKEEALELVEKARDVLGQNLGSRIVEQVLEFSGGFPWLQKRILAHVIGLVKEGVAEEEILAKGLRLEELFEADIAALDEPEKDFLRQLAKLLPATLEDLTVKFGDGDELLGRLQLLQHQRLIRLSGWTYDVYNDFFKEWLVSGRSPIEFKYIFRLTPGTSLRAFSQIVDENLQTLEDLTKALRRKQGSVFNVLRELRLLGLVDYSRGKISVPAQVRTALADDALGPMIQLNVRRNRLVQFCLARINLARGLKLPEVAEIVREQFPFVEAGAKTWNSYARVLAGWMREVKLVHWRKDVIFPRAEYVTPDFWEIIRREPFVPFSSFQNASSVLGKVRRGGAFALSRQGAKALSDLKALGLMEGYAGHIALTPAGRDVVNRGQTGFRDFVSDFMLAQSYVSQFLSRMRSLSGSRQKELFYEIIQQFGDYDWNAVTIEWRFRLLRNWLEMAGLVSNLAGRIVLRKGTQAPLPAV